MNHDAFESRLQRQPLRPLPGEWRAGILSAARQAVSAQAAPRATPPVHVPRSLLSTLNSQLSTLLWPHPMAWTGLAAVWLVILGINLATRDATARVARHAAPVSPQVFMAFQEQERLLSELIGPSEPPATEPPPPHPPRPRSEGRRGMVMT
jgi:hypothetical protein